MSVTYSCSHIITINLRRKPTYYIIEILMWPTYKDWQTLLPLLLHNYYSCLTLWQCIYGKWQWSPGHGRTQTEHWQVCHNIANAGSWGTLRNIQCKTWISSTVSWICVLLRETRNSDLLMTKIRSLAAVYKALEVHVCNTQYNVTNVQSPRIIVIALSFVTGQVESQSYGPVTCKYWKKS